MGSEQGTTGMFTEADRRQMEASGRDVAEVAHQVERLRLGMAWTPLARAATVGDGIRRIAEDDVPRLLKLQEAAARSGRLSAFVPASGAGTRLFQSLLRTRNEGLSSLTELRFRRVLGDLAVSEPLRLLEHITELALWPDLAARGADPADPAGVLERLFGDEHLAAHRLPKGLLPFHAYEDHRRTSFEEHLAEHAGLCTDADGVCRLRFTVSPEHQAGFEALLAEIRPRVEARTGVSFAVSFSNPDPRTDAAAIDAEGQPVRLADGSLLFRPGGHGGLLGNLAGCGGDVVLLKNIDNVFPEPALEQVLPYRRRVVGLLLSIEARVHAAIHLLRKGEGLETALHVLEDVFGVVLPEDEADPAAWALDRLHRPLRVCGMIRNHGQPGGGPFWVSRSSGQVTLQIVEGAQIDKGEPDQAAILAASTHFNPVEIVASLRDVDGQPFSLPEYVDPDGVIITAKSYEGRPISVFEHPGLWNAAMARWNTVFVEVPDHMFNPVKRLGDLLDPSHRV